MLQSLKNFQDIYPEEFELGKENCSNLEASFLDLDINIKDGKPTSLIK